MSRSWIYFRLAQIILDTFLVYTAFLCAYFLRVGFLFSTDFPFLPYSLLTFGATVLWISFLGFTKYYRVPPRSGMRVSFDITLVFLGGLIAVGALIATYFFQRETVFSRLLTGYSFAFGSVLLLLSQYIFRKLLAHKKRQHKDIYQTLIIGANTIAEKIISAIDTNPYAPYHIIGVIDPYGLEKNIKGSKILGKLDKLEALCEEKKITALIQCDAFEHTLNLISLCEEKNIKFQFEPSLRGIFEENLRIREVAGMPMISFVQRDFLGIKKARYRLIDWILRQVFDVD